MSVLGDGAGASTLVYVECKAADDCMAGVDATAQGGKNTAAPVDLLGGNVVHAHVMVDGKVVETIFNNRTAMVTYSGGPRVRVGCEVWRLLV